MPRPRQYDEAEVLASAMHVFWKHGYGASTRRLAAAMGINQYSVYACFENKAGLFERALNLYIDDIVEGSALMPLLSRRAAMPELRKFLEGFVNTRNQGVPDGCLVCNTMIERAEHSEPVLQAITRYRELVTKAFWRALRNGFPDMPAAVVHARSEFLFGAILGLFIQKKMGLDGRPVQVFVDEMMAAVERDFE